MRATSSLLDRLRPRRAHVGALFALPVVALAHACGGGGDEGAAPGLDAGDDVADVAPADAPSDGIGAPLACVRSKSPAPFPDGACVSPTPPTADAFDEALALAKLDRCKLALDKKQVPASGWKLDDPRRLPDYEPLVLAPLRLPAYGAETARWFDDALAGASPVASALAAASQRRGAAITTCPDPTWGLVDEHDGAPLATALGEIAAASGADFDLPSTQAAVASVPLDLQRALVPVVRAVGYGAAAVTAARKTDDARTLATLESMGSWFIGTRNPALTADFLAAMDGVDVAKMTEAATWIATAIEGANLGRFAGADVTLELDTSFGPLVVHGGGSDNYAPGSRAETAALLLDLGGDDVYRVPVGAAGVARPVAVSIDLGGKDTYGYVEKSVPDDKAGSRLTSDSFGRFPTPPLTRSRVARQGAGVLGVGLLFDLGASTDHYQSLALSQGAALFGVGVLYDDGGDDTYLAEVYGQGAGGFGVGLLLDRAGNDTYKAYSQVQGWGGTQGLGALIDGDGDDVYFTDPGDPSIGGDPLYPNAQLPDHGNTSMAQGCGQGRRSDTVPEKIGFLGGMGVLRDRGAGKDAYTTSVFGQAAGFQGAGFLLDDGGDDVYEGLWYVQGADAHLGVAYFHDRAGNDRYDPTFPIKATSIGVGHDFSVAVHYDEAGDDVYFAPGLSLGSGYDNGIGVLVNVGGLDVFKAAGNPTLGGAAVDGTIAASPRVRLPTYGVFTKAGGSATYSLGGVDDPGRVGGSWSYAPENTPADAGADGGDGGDAGGTPITAEHSTGVDRPSGTASLP